MAVAAEAYTYHNRRSDFREPIEVLDWSENLEGESLIFDYYSIGNEINFLRENADVSREKLEFYVGANIKCFLGEFIGGLPYKAISYAQKDGYLDFADMRMEESYRRAANMAGKGSREEADLNGFAYVQENINSAGNVVVQLSPPKDADYSFLNIYVTNGEESAELGGVRVDEYLIRYDEEKGSVDKSRWLYSGLTGLPCGFNSANDFLSNPVIKSLDDPEEQVRSAMKLLGISKEEVDRGEQFEKDVEGDECINMWISEYADKAISLSLFDGLAGEKQRLIDELKVYISAICGRAGEIKDRIDDPATVADSLQENFYSWSFDSLEGFENKYSHAEVVGALAHYANKVEQISLGGSDCRVTTNSVLPGLGSLYEGLSGRRSIDQIMNEGSVDYKNDPNLCSCSSASEAHFHCPGKKCNYAIVVGKGIKKCPGCGEGAKCK